MMKSEHGRIDLLTQEQIDWCDKHCNFEWFVKNDKKVYSRSDDNIHFKDRDLIVSFPVHFGDCEWFSCYRCDLLKSLKGAFENISGDYDCSYCKSLESLEGAPESVGGDFICSWCKSLKLLKGVPKKIGKDFYCYHCDLFKSIDELKNTKIGGKIRYYGCFKLKKYDFILGDMNVFRIWQKSEYTADEFMKEWSGYLNGQKYGI